MVLAVKIPKKNAEDTIRSLSPLINKEFRILQKNGWVYIPVKTPPEGYEVVDVELPARRRATNLKEELRSFLTEDEMKEVVTSFDIVGDVIIIRLPPSLMDKAEKIGEVLHRIHPHVRSVAVEVGPFGGTYRVPELKVVWGDENLETIYREHGVRMKLDPSKVYFSVRHSYERIRIARMIGKDEIVGVFFAGVGPYPLVFAKHSPARWVYAIELNPVAWKYMVENVEMNRMERKIIPIRGDVKDVVPRMFPGFAHRVVMPLPKDSHHFLDEAFMALRREGGIIHYYTFAPSSNPLEKLPLIERKAEEWGFAIKRIEWRRVADYAPRVWKVVLDIYTVSNSSAE